MTIESTARAKHKPHRPIPIYARSHWLMSEGVGITVDLNSSHARRSHRRRSHAPEPSAQSPGMLQSSSLLRRCRLSRRRSVGGRVRVAVLWGVSRPPLQAAGRRPSAADRVVVGARIIRCFGHGGCWYKFFFRSLECSTGIAGAEETNKLEDGILIES